MRTLLSVVIALVVVGATFNATPANAGGREVTSDRLGCKSREYFEKLFRYVADGDKEAAKKAYMAGLLSGECTSFKKGEQVFTTDTAIFSGLVKLRRKGETVEYWTNFEAITD